MKHICCICGEEAHYQLKNGKWYCSESFYKCPGYKRKLKNAAIDDWKRIHEMGITSKKDIPTQEQKRTQKQKQIPFISNTENPICCYCGGPGVYQKKNGEWLCSKYVTQCPEIRKRNSEKNKQLYKEGRKSGTYGKPAWNKGLTDLTDSRVAKMHRTLGEHYKSGKIVSSGKGRQWSKEARQKISESRKKFLQEHPDKVPYLLNHSSRISYPEQYFIDLFKNESISLDFHKQIGVYELDFYNEKLKKYVEIDGEQHYLESSIERDRKRDEYFKSIGWTGIRIRWAEWQKFSEEERKDKVNEIKNFLK